MLQGTVINNRFHCSNFPFPANLENCESKNIARAVAQFRPHAVFSTLMGSGEKNRQPPNSACARSPKECTSDVPDHGRVSACGAGERHAPLRSGYILRIALRGGGDLFRTGVGVRQGSGTIRIRISSTLRICCDRLTGRLLYWATVGLLTALRALFDGL
jgi:hypothetical protein